MALNFEQDQDADYIEQQAKLADWYRNAEAQKQRIRAQWFHLTEMLGTKENADDLYKTVVYLIKKLHHARQVTPAESKRLKEAFDFGR